jgi:polyribonucleotide nucleotidyltransferase
VNVTKFGAFVNILPGRDGLLHISKIGGGKRIDKVEDVLDLGDSVEVRVDDVDPNGKVSLSLASAPAAAEGESSSSDRGDRGDRGGDAPAAAPAAEADNGAEREYVSFEDAFDSEITAELGDLGPAGDDRGGESRGGGGGRGRGGRGGGGGGGRRR